MGDTQRSSTISTDNQGIAVQNSDKAELKVQKIVGNDRPPTLVRESSLARIRILARREPDMVFTSLAHRIEPDLLKKSFRRLKKSKSSGVDKITAKQYAENLDENLYKLHQRLRRGQYVAFPVRRIWIDKENGKERPIGITALEDKIVQKAVATLLNIAFDVNFYDFSHGFREGHSQHMAINELREKCRKLNIGWIISADITGLFDNLDRSYLREMISRRVNDGRILRLIGKWLNAGVMEGDKVIYPDTGVPQGAVISPVLSNIFLHYVLDEWFVKEVMPRMKGRCFIIRFADDFIVGCELGSDARRIMEVMPKRFGRYNLVLHPEKTVLIPFARPKSHDKGGKGKGTVDFLGFTFYWSRSRQGYWLIKKKTARKRLCRFMRMLWHWCKENRHESMWVQYDALCSKLRGFYQYFGVRSNYKALETVFEYAERAWRRWLNRRSQNGVVLFEHLRASHPFPKPRIVHNI